jgi:phage-related protein
MLEPPVLRPVVWLGNSKKNLRDFPNGAQKLLGDELQLIQFGGMPRDAKPFKGVGSGVLEIALRYASDAYRVVQYRSAGGFMFCTPFRRNRREVLKPRSGKLT